MSVVLSQLFVYPVKSATGIALAQAKVVARGLEHDRRFMIVDPSGMLVTLRERPELARVTTILDGACLRLEAPGMPPFELPLDYNGGSRTTVFMWTTPVNACVVEEATAWICAFLRGDYRLAYMPESTHRPYHERNDTPLSFVDGNPLSLVSEASLTDLNARLEAPVDLRNFRHNLVVKGCEAYAEDAWDTLHIGDLTLERLGPCVRCMLVNVDPDKGIHKREPLRTLARYRQVNREVHFGVLYRIASGVLSTISRGDTVTFTKQGEIRGTA